MIARSFPGNTFRALRTAGRVMVVTAALVMVGTGGGWPRAAHAEDPVQKIVQLNRKALEDYDILEFESAKKALLEAVNTAKKGGVEGHPLVARTHVHLGIVYINGFKDRFKGFQQFQKALAIQGDIKLDKNLATAELNEVFDSARDDLKSKGTLGPTGKAVAAAKPSGKAKAAPVDEDEDDSAPAPAKGKAVPVKPPAPKVAPKAAVAKGGDDEDEDEAPVKKKGAAKKAEPKKVEIEEPDMPANIAALDCPNADEAPPKKDIALRCAVNAGLGVTKVFLFYRPPGKEDMVPVPMVQSKKGWWNGVIPGDVVTGKSLQFYFEGRNAQGKPVVSNGRSDSPNLMLIMEGAKAVGSGATAILDLQKEVASSPDLEIEENPFEQKAGGAPRVQLGQKAVDPNAKKPREFGDRMLWVGLLAGSGLGFSFGGANGVPEYRTEFTETAAGVLPSALGHGALEIGYYINPQIAVAIQSRNQYIPQPALSGAATGAHAAMARFLYFIGKQRDRGRMFASMMAGGGEGFRLVIHPDSNNSTFKDTIRGGPFIGGLGFGYTYDLSPLWAVVGEANALVGAPKLAAVLDVHVGIQIVF